MDINQFNPAAFAALAGNTTPNLGLKAYGVEDGRVVQAQMHLELMKRQNEQDQIASQKQIADMQENGLLSRAEAKQAADLRSQAIDQQFQQKYRDADRQVTMLRDQSTSMYHAGMLNNGNNANQIQLMNNQSLNQYRQGQLDQGQQQIGLNQANNQSLDQYRQGQLDQGQQQIDQTKIKDSIKQSADMKKEDRMLVLHTASALQQVIQDPKSTPEQKQTMINQVLKTAKDQGAPADVIDQMASLDLPTLSKNTAATIMIGTAANAVANKKVSSPDQLTTNKDGTVGFAQPEKDPGAYSLAGQLNKSDGGTFTTENVRYNDFNAIAGNLADARTALAKVPDGLMKPWTPDFVKNMNPTYQEYGSTIKALALSTKDAIFRLGGGQGFTDADREYLDAIASGGPGAYKETAGVVFDRINGMLDRAKKQSYGQLHDIVTRSKDADRISSWEKLHPDPTAAQSTQDATGAADPTVSWVYKDGQLVRK